MAVIANDAVQLEFLLAGLRDTSGNPLNGGKVHTYAAGTTTDKTTWRDADKVTAAPNPIILDGNGQEEIFADGLYRIIVEDANDVPLYDWDFLEFQKGFRDTAETVSGVKTFSDGILTDTIDEVTGAAGVTVDGVLLKDNEVYADAIIEKTTGSGVTLDDPASSTDGVRAKDKVLETDNITERQTDAGVTIETVLIKDGGITGGSGVLMDILGVLMMTTMWGNGEDGSYSSSGSGAIVSGLYHHTTFVVNSGHTLTLDGAGLFIFATTSINIDGTISAAGKGAGGGAGGSSGTPGAAGSTGAAGSGGGGGGSNAATAGGAGGDATYVYRTASGGAGGAAAAPGSIGGAHPTGQTLKHALAEVRIGAGGGGGGGDGGGFGGSGGDGGGFVLLCAPTITIGGSATITAVGAAGGGGTSNDGGGGGGGGGCIVLISPNYTSTGTVSVSGGAGGQNGAGQAGGAGGAGVIELVELPVG